ncbi:MAG: Binding-protein-dependent transport systems inner membrane component [Acetothermia bacterium 64_32]|nr:MAG: Binding-protein-dependent transport systems inner membrane component [Acetothermia bacterium 64_32]HAF71081.1 D,D-dipeptide ABC transporter permease [Candidatus Acetothermia bacterium]
MHWWIRGYATRGSEWRRALGRLWRSRLALVGLAIVVALVVVAVFAPWIAPYSPTKINLRERLKPPSVAHPFGTDDAGRDILSRVIYGSRVTLRICVLVVGLTLGIGTLLGLISGYFGGWVDEVLMRVSDVFLAFPALILAMAIAAALGPSLENAIVAMVAIWWPRYARVTRGQVLSIREIDFVAAARAAGASSTRIMLRHILPNCISPVVVQATLDLGEVVLTAATLSFIGFGAQPPTPEWGAMVSVGRNFLRDYWWYTTFPGLAILITVMGFNLLGDAVRDILDPRLRRGP